MWQRGSYDLPTLHHLISGVVSLTTLQVVLGTYCIWWFFCVTWFIEPDFQRNFIHPYCVCSSLDPSHDRASPNPAQLSSAHLNMVPLSNRGTCLSGRYSLLFPTAPLNHFIFITCLAGTQPLTFDSLRPTWDRHEIDCQECGRGGKEECNAG